MSSWSHGYDEEETVTHKQHVKNLDELKKGEDTPEFIKFIKTKADGQEIFFMTRIQQGGDSELKNKKSRTYHTV